MRITRFLVVKHCMSMRESTSTDILSRDTNHIAAGQNTRVSEAFSHAPINGQRTLRHLLAIGHHFANLTLEVKCLRYFG